MVSCRCCCFSTARLIVFADRREELPTFHLDLELPLHAVDEDVEVQLAHALDDGLAGLRG